MITLHNGKINLLIFEYQHIGNLRVLTTLDKHS